MILRELIEQLQTIENSQPNNHIPVCLEIEIGSERHLFRDIEIKRGYSWNNPPLPVTIVLLTADNTDKV